MIYAYIDARTFMKKFLSYDSSCFKFLFLFEVTKLDFVLHFNLFRVVLEHIFHRSVT